MISVRIEIGLSLHKWECMSVSVYVIVSYISMNGSVCLSVFGAFQICEEEYVFGCMGVFVC